MAFSEYLSFSVLTRKGAGHGGGCSSTYRCEISSVCICYRQWIQCSGCIFQAGTSEEAIVSIFAGPVTRVQTQKPERIGGVTQPVILRASRLLSHRILEAPVMKYRQLFAQKRRPTQIVVHVSRELRQRLLSRFSPVRNHMRFMVT